MTTREPLTVWRSRGRPLRWLLSYAATLGLVPSPRARPQGISAIVRVKDEEEWIEPCLRSVADAVDELIVVDNGSTDRSPDILNALARQFASKMKLFFRPGEEFVAISNFGLAQTHYRWILKWDADFVAYTSGPRSIANLRQRLFRLPQDRHHHIHLTCLELMGDLKHQLPRQHIRRDPFVATFSPGLRFVRVSRTIPQPEMLGLTTILRTDSNAVYTFHFEDVGVPLWYRVFNWPEMYFVHLQIDSAQRMYLRDCWVDWLENPEFQRHYTSLEEYAVKRAQAVWGTHTLEEAAKEFMHRACQRLVPYATDRWGDLPELLQPHLAHPRYHVLYKDGKPWSRSDVAPSA